MISTDGWRSPPPADELPFRGPKHPIMLLGRFCSSCFLSRDYTFHAFVHFHCTDVHDVVIICRFISLFCPDLAKYGPERIVFAPCYFAGCIVQWWRQIADWWFSYSANCHIFMLASHCGILCCVYIKTMHKSLKKKNHQDNILKTGINILWNICALKLVHIRDIALRSAHYRNNQLIWWSSTGTLFCVASMAPLPIPYHIPNTSTL